MGPLRVPTLIKMAVARYTQSRKKGEGKAGASRRVKPALQVFRTFIELKAPVAGHASPRLNPRAQPVAGWGYYETWERERQRVRMG